MTIIMVDDKKINLCLSLLIFTLVGQSRAAALSGCLPDSPCTCAPPRLSCSGQGISAVPEFTSSAQPYDTIDLRHNRIRRLENFAFANLTWSPLVKIYLSDNPIEYIDDLAFVGLRNTSVYLDITNTKLTTLPTALVSLDHLGGLGVDFSLDPEIMVTVGQSLRSVYLRSATVWPFGLRYANNLNHLDVAGLNGINLPSDAFNGLENSLVKLKMSQSAINNPPDAVCSLLNLQSLSMVYITFQPGVASLPKCDQPMRTVTSLTLEYITMATVPDISAVFPSLNHLFLRHNSLRDETFPEGIVPRNLTELDLSYNQLTQVPVAVRELGQLRTLTLANNYITSLTTGSLSGLTYLWKLELSNNPIVSVAADTFMSTPALHVVDLRQTHLTTVPQAIRHLKSAYVLLHDNQIYCSCDLAWLLSLTTVTSNQVLINGTCYLSNVEISDFVSSVLKDCEVEIS